MFSLPPPRHVSTLPLPTKSEFRKHVGCPGVDRKWLVRDQNDANDPKPTRVGVAGHSEIGWIDPCEILS